METEAYREIPPVAATCAELRELTYLIAGEQPVVMRHLQRELRSDKGAYDRGIARLLGAANPQDALHVKRCNTELRYTRRAWAKHSGLAAMREAVAELTEIRRRQALTSW